MGTGVHTPMITLTPTPMTTRMITPMVMTRITDGDTAMTTDAAALVLQHWLSPSFPVGGFAYSQGIEAAVDSGVLNSGEDLGDWLRDLLRHGSLRSDAICLSLAHRAVDQGTITAQDQTARAFATGRERLEELSDPGAAFCLAIKQIWQHDLADLTYPVALGYAARLQNLPLALSLEMFLHGQVANLIAAGQRLLPIGQIEGQRLLAGLSAQIAETARNAEDAQRDDLSSASFAADILSMRHETQYSRIFRT